MQISRKPYWLSDKLRHGTEGVILETGFKVLPNAGHQIFKDQAKALLTQDSSQVSVSSWSKNSGFW